MTSWFKRILEPFIPPPLRMNEDTLAELPTKEQMMEVWTKFCQFWTFQRFGMASAYVLSLYGMEIYWGASKLYLIISLFVMIWLNLGDTTRDGQMSAYSIFNRGGERMLGSINAEQFENEIRHNRPLPQEQEPVAQPAPDQVDDLAAQEERDLQLALQISLAEEEQRREGLKKGSTKKRKGKKKK